MTAQYMPHLRDAFPFITDAEGQPVLGIGFVPGCFLPALIIHFTLADGEELHRHGVRTQDGEPLAYFVVSQRMMRDCFIRGEVGYHQDYFEWDYQGQRSADTRKLRTKLDGSIQVHGGKLLFNFRAEILGIRRNKQGDRYVGTVSLECDAGVACLNFFLLFHKTQAARNAWTMRDEVMRCEDAGVRGKLIETMGTFLAVMQVINRLPTEIQEATVVALKRSLDQWLVIVAEQYPQAKPTGREHLALTAGDGVIDAEAVERPASDAAAQAPTQPAAATG